MKVLRNQELETSNIQVGDQIVLHLAELGDFTATAQEISENGTLFLFDDCVVKRTMNRKYTNKGGYEKSDLCRWINTTLLEAFPEDIKSGVKSLSLPTYGQLFGHDDWYEEVLEPDNDERFSLMEKRKNRIADFNSHYEWYWLRNSTNKLLSAAYFALVNNNGAPYYGNASDSRGVRPVFLLA